MKSAKLNFLVLLVSINLSMWSQKTWSLDDCIGYALEHNLFQKGSELATEKSKEYFTQSKREFLPRINASTGYSINFGRYIDVNTNDYINTQSFSNRYYLESTLDIFNGFRKWNAISYNKFLFQASKEATLNAKYQLTFSVMDAYHFVLFRKGLLEIAEEQQELTLLQYKMISKKVELGLSATSDLLEIESTMASEQVRVIRAMSALESAQLILLQEMNLDEKSIEILSMLDEGQKQNAILRQNVEDTFNKAIRFYPLIKQQEFKLRAAEKSLSMTRGSLYPSVSFNSGYGTGYYETRVDPLGNIIGFKDQLKDNATKYFNFSLNIPISNRWANRSRVKLAKIKVSESVNQLQQQKLNLYKEIQTALQKSEALFAEKEANGYNLEAKEMAYTIAKKKYEKGLINIYDLQQVKNVWTIAKIEQVRVAIQLKIQQKTIDFYNGNPVFQVN